MTDHIIRTLDDLRAVYDLPPAAPAIAKESDHVTPEYRRLIESSPFLALSSVSENEIDCSPRGDKPGFVRVHDDKTLMLPDRRGNNRIDTLKNIVQDPRVSLMFMIPGSGTVLRVNGRGEISIDPDLCASFAEQGKAPRSVLIVHVDIVYFQCARAIMRAKLWDADALVDPAKLPTPGDILAERTEHAIDADAYDKEWPGRAAKSMW